MSQPQPQVNPERVKSVFEYIDTDKDGRVTWDEVKAFSAQPQFADLGWTVEMMMDGKGVKKDQAVTLEEFKAFFGL
ncbi:hypothetical protein ACH5AG_40820 [Streptomyces anulatus]